jgi:hypothetical protein
MSEEVHREERKVGAKSATSYGTHRALGVYLALFAVNS